MYQVFLKAPTKHNDKWNTISQIKIQSLSSISRILHTSKHDHDLCRKNEKRAPEKKREEERERSPVQMHRSVDYTRSPKIWNEHVRNVAAEPDEKERMINVRGAEMHTFTLLSPFHRPSTPPASHSLCKVFSIHRC